MDGKQNIKTFIPPNPFPDSNLPDLRNTRVRVKLATINYWPYISFVLFLLFLCLLFFEFVFEINLYYSFKLSDIINVLIELSRSKRYLFSLFAIILSVAIYVSKRPVPVYLVNFQTFKPDAKYQCSYEKFKYLSKNLTSSVTGEHCFTQSSLDFQIKLLEKSCISDFAYLPSGIVEMNPPNLSMKSARAEAEMVMFTIIEDLFKDCNFLPKDIDILIVNCSLFCPTPSLSAMIINKFKFKSKIKSYNLGGMGCSAGIISIDLAKDLLQVHPNSNCLVISTENITQNWYPGNEKGMLITNTLFKMGGAAILLSNKRKYKNKSLFKLTCTVRTHMGRDDDCYYSIYQEEDSMGIKGVRLAKTIMSVAGDALKSNITTLAPMYLPWSQQINFFLNYFARFLLKKEKLPFLSNYFSNLLYKLAYFLFYLPKPNEKSLYCSFCQYMRYLCSLPINIKDDEEFENNYNKNLVGRSYIPDFTTAFQHFCVHAGGRAVIDAIEKNLNLVGTSYMDASRYALYRYGNTSSASIWYEMEYHLHHSSLKKGDNIWQIGFGSGFKCNSAVWCSLIDNNKNITDAESEFEFEKNEMKGTKNKKNK